MGQIPEFNLTNAFNLSTISPSQANEQYLKKHAHASPAARQMGVSGSQLKIPTITIHNQSFYNQKVSPRHFAKDRQANHSNSRSPELSNVASGYLRASNSNSPQQFNKTIYQMPSINVIQSSGVKKGKELRSKINSQIQRSQLKLQVISERNEQNRQAMQGAAIRTKGQNNFPNVVSPKSGTINPDSSYPSITGGPSPEKTQRGPQRSPANQPQGPPGIPQIRKNTQYNTNFNTKQHSHSTQDPNSATAMTTNTNGFKFGSRRLSNA